MSTPAASPSWTAAIPLPVLVVMRGIGQVFFQEHALTGTLFVVGIALSSPLMALGAVVGSAVGTGLAWVLKFDRGEIVAGIFGFNAALVGIASFFFFEPGLVSVVLMLGGCLVATGLTRLMRGYLPFPTYTTPFIVTTWAVFFLGRALGAASAGPGYGPLVPEIPTGPVLEAAAHGVSQVMFQASMWTALFFLAGIAVSERRHAAWVLLGSVAGMLLAGWHVDAAARSLDPEQLVERPVFENIQLGLYGYNATLVAVALFLWRRSVIPPLLGMLFTVPLTELIPRLGLPALTAPFVLATWLVMILAWLDHQLFADRSP
jgi:urea transporter